MPTLAEIAESEQVVLFDSSTIGLESFSQLIYHARKYADLDRKLLMSAQESLGEFLEGIGNENTFTVEDALKDFESLHNAISTKQGHLNASQERLKPKYATHGEQKQLVFKDIAKHTFRLLELLRSKLYVPESQDAYGALRELITHLLPKSSTSPSQKDMQLYAAALYLSTHQKMSVALVVRGREFENNLVLLINRLKTEEPTSFQSSNLALYPIKLYANVRKQGHEMVYTTHT